MKVLLVILFTVNGEPTIIQDGYMPIEVDANVCDQRAEFARDYLENDLPDEHPPLYGVFCGTEQELQERFNIEFNSIPT